MIRRTSANKQVKKQVVEQILVNPQISVQNSVEVLKKLTVIAVSSITYLRNLFPEDTYSAKQIVGVPIKMIKRVDLPGIVTFASWMRGATQLISSYYLKKIILVIQKERTNETLEIYTFQYDYNHEQISCKLLSDATGEEVSVCSNNSILPADIAESVRQLIRSIVTMTALLKPLPLHECEFSLRLELDENTPDDYELPQFFKAIDSYDFNFPSEASRLKLGKVESKFMKFGVSSKSIFYQNADDGKEEEEDFYQTSPIESHDLTSNSTFKKTNSARENSLEAGEADHGSNNTAILMIIHCICECDEEDQFDGTIKCLSCSTFQHKACYNLPEHFNMDCHICVNCHDSEKNKICSAPELVNDINRKGDALYRRALVLCMNISQISRNEIMTHLKVNRQKAANIFNKLDFDGCFLPSSQKGFSKKIDTEHLKKNIAKRYFNAPVDVRSYLHMDVEDNSSTLNSRNHLEGRKRQHDEDKENTIQEINAPAQYTRRKILETSKKPSLAK